MCARSLSRTNPDHAVKLLVGRRFELFGHVGDAVGVVPRVAYDERIFTQLLPASRQRGDGRRIARPFEEGTAGDRQRGLLVQEIDRRRGRQDIMALVIARKVEVYLEFAVVAHAAHAEVLPPFPGNRTLGHENTLFVDSSRTYCSRFGRRTDVRRPYRTYVTLRYVRTRTTYRTDRPYRTGPVRSFVRSLRTYLRFRFTGFRSLRYVTSFVRRYGRYRYRRTGPAGTVPYVPVVPVPDRSGTLVRFVRYRTGTGTVRYRYLRVRFRSRGLPVGYPGYPGYPVTPVPRYRVTRLTVPVTPVPVPREPVTGGLPGTVSVPVRVPETGVKRTVKPDGVP